MTNRNKLIHDLLGRGCWHEPETKATMLGDYEDVCKHGCDLPAFWDGNPDYINDANLPHSLVVEIVTKAVERFGRWDVMAAIEKKAELPFMGTYGLMIPAPVIVGAVADMCEEVRENG